MNEKQLATLAARLPEPERNEFIRLAEEANRLFNQVAALRSQAAASEAAAWTIYHSVVPPRAIQKLTELKQREQVRNEMLGWLQLQQAPFTKHAFVEGRAPALSRGKARNLFDELVACGTLCKSGQFSAVNTQLWCLA